ncbi:hypothetical protein OIDMADRAFT_55924 [Oidiodendron maius Zn]|uniref:NADH:flavin oxidoreductase/NADH oxidase N-terminal domain-containing protein n=1 Tax=Oidiodendron maius (strain Zn) TaxID=913774 RepID=A0A0C3GV99_OIDMZ|nr:hypothetical protein OIDMADRAFT_55924 [Oidiodendron maius Zn]
MSDKLFRPLMTTTSLSSRWQKNIMNNERQFQAGGYANVPDAVHAKGSFIFVQLWAVGRAAKADVLKKTGHKVVSSSAIAISPDQPPPHALTESEIQEYISDYIHVARNAITAGFDGVQLHSANRCLRDQFLQDVVYQRTDKWGGSIENRSRFSVEITKALIAAVGKERVSVRLSPFTSFHPGGAKMKNPVPRFTHVIKELKALDIAFLDVIEPRVTGGPTDVVYAEAGSLDFAVEAWGKEKPVVIAGGFTAKMAKKIVEERYADYQVIVAFGRYFISTPDLPFRMHRGLEFNPYDRPTFYTPGPKGYVDYPLSAEFITEFMGSTKI